MARKKNRQLNIAHKRAKRNQVGKSRQRQMAFRKQRMLESAKSDGEQLQDRIMKSGLLVNEPELEKVRFDTERLYQAIRELLHLPPPNFVRSEDQDELTRGEDWMETISEKFRDEVLPCLITPNFLQLISQSLKACETRLKRIGAREKAEIAVVTRMFFDLAEPASLNFHPLILNICVRTLETVSTQSQLGRDEHEAIQWVIYDLLAISQGENIRDQQIHTIDEQVSDGLDNGFQKSSDIADYFSDEDEPTQTSQTPTPRELPAKALYKNLDWERVRQTFELGDGYRLTTDGEQQAQYSHKTQHRYVTLTADRLLLQCPRKAQLNDAMQEIEQLCGKSVFYLAKVLDE
ncbi:MAG: hypothetical protein OXP71_01960 [Candidatus Poribacteria bacterium]|nr:hypothetical protein [Candidatus Poribacteria bacterium]